MTFFYLCVYYFYRGERSIILLHIVWIINHHNISSYNMNDVFTLKSQNIKGIPSVVFDWIYSCATNAVITSVKELISNGARVFFIVTFFCWMHCSHENGRTEFSDTINAFNTCPHLSTTRAQFSNRTIFFA